MSDEADQADPAEATDPADYVSAGPPTCAACGRFIPGPQADPPGSDEITVTAPEGRPLCSNRAHRDLGLRAAVVVTFGQLGTLYLLDEALWPETWGCSYPFCGECWDTVRQLAARKRPGLVIRDATKPAEIAAGRG